MTEKISNLKRKYVLFAAAVIILYTALYLGIFAYNKTFELNGDINSFKSISIDKGEYALSMEYSSESPIYLECGVSTKGQDFIIEDYIIESGDSNLITVPLTIPYDIRNGSFYVRAANVDPGLEYVPVINSISFNYVGTVIYEAFIAVLLAALIILVLLKSDSKAIFRYIFAAGVSFIILHDIFVASPLVALIYTILFAFIIIFKPDICLEARVFWMMFLAMLCLMCFFSSFSPLFTRGLARDTGAYYAMAEGLVHGKVPYRDIFDHKGPILYFIYAIGYLLCPGGTEGVFVIETLLMTLAVFSVYKIAVRVMSKSASYMASVMSILVLMDPHFTRSAGSVEQWSTGLLLITLYIMFKNDNRHISYFIQGLLFSLVFYTKFNVATAWPVIAIFCGLRLLSRKQYINFIKAVIAYVGAFGIVSALLGAYFAVNNAVNDFINTYFVFNIMYGREVGSMTGRVISRLYEFFADDKIVMALILSGMIIFCVSKRFGDIWSKLGLVSSLIFLLYAATGGTRVYDYYYCIIAVYAVFGIIGVMSYAEDFFIRLSDGDIKASGEIPYKIPRSTATAMIICIGMLFVINDRVVQSDIVDREPKMQDVVTYEMKRNAKADASFVEWDMLEYGLFAAMDQAPQFKYFYIPNVDYNTFSEPYNEMARYCAEGNPEFVVVERFSRDSYLEGDWLSGYEYLNLYDTQDGTGRVLMIYQRRN